MRLLRKARRRNARIARRLIASHTAAVLMLFMASFNGGFLMTRGLLMLVDPLPWLPAAPASAGTFHLHLMRDLGVLQLLLATAFALGLVLPQQRAGLWTAATLCLTAQVALQLWNIDIGVLVPANGALLCLWAIHRSRAEEPRLADRAGLLRDART